jgi:hydrogenase-4 component F
MIAFLIIFPLAAAVVLFLFKSDILNRSVTTLYSAIYLFCAVSFTMHRPSDMEPYFMVDPLNIIFILVTAILYFGISLSNITYFKDSDVPVAKQTTYYISLMLFVFSMNGFMLSQHLGLNWVFLEATTLATAYLIYFDKTDEALDAAWKYIFICTIGISFAFVGIIFISKGVGGSVEELFYSNLYLNAKNIDTFWINIGFLFIVLGFGTKMGLAPMHSWLPDAHSEAPSPMSAMLSGTLLNLAFLGILRVYKIMIAADDLLFAKNILLIMGFLSLVFSAAFILKIKNYKKMLAYSSIENMGIIAIGFCIGGSGVFAAFLHMIGHSLTKASFFLTAGNILHRYGTKESAKISSLMHNDYKTGILWLFSFISIAALPPFPLFISEFMIVREMIGKGKIILTVIFLLLLTIILYGIAKTIFRMLFGNTDNNTGEHHYDGILLYLPQIMFISLLLILGVYIPEPVMKILNDAVSMFGLK